MGMKFWRICESVYDPVWSLYQKKWYLLIPMGAKPLNFEIWNGCRIVRHKSGRNHKRWHRDDILNPAIPLGSLKKRRRGMTLLFRCTKHILYTLYTQYHTCTYKLEPSFGMNILQYLQPKEYSNLEFLLYLYGTTRILGSLRPPSTPWKTAQRHWPLMWRWATTNGEENVKGFWGGWGWGSWG